MGFILCGCDPFGTQFESIEPAVFFQAHAHDGGERAEAHADGNPEHLVVMTWNIKFGGGRIDFFFDGHGERVIMTREEVLENLKGVARKINQVNPHVLLLQEVDSESKRSGGVNMVQWLLDHTALSYGVYASQWKSSWIPLKGLGRINSGNAVLSRFPIVEAKRIALPLVEEMSWLRRYFYLKRNILEARIDFDEGKPLVVLNTHLEAFAHDGTKERQLRLLAGRMDELDAQGALVVTGGDFNAIPPGSTQVRGFSDSVSDDPNYQADDFTGEEDLLDPLYSKYSEVVPLDEYRRDNRPNFTHTTQSDGFWNRKLDYIFTNGQFVSGSGLTHQDPYRGGMETMPLSDHAPISVTLQR